MTTVYDFTVQTAGGENKSLKEYEGNPMVIVNTASKCGFTKQFKELQELYEEYKDQGLVILGFPSDNFNNQEFDDIDETVSFCQVNYGVTFPMFAKVDVKGESAEPLFTYLSEQQKGVLTEGIKWNFTKFLIDSDGQVVDRFAPQTNPLKMQKSIDKLLHE
ncbi:glutathione peroxidase [Sporosarcina sp. P37]|uniref:glutathione peroxidase n=1 Tax=unclassified Sporosarcina TaxID=2647733 RepID=UPI0009BD7245|nr:MULTISPECIES: glutathione peroxidase [unclassified Sporosarcina]ARD48401.1 glutathione peroxidase [Sporosarcina sp. P33]ARK24905.1 glutathione peroxidase [Sporosarcina sp. P37]PID17116.1 glutathione peroxidase [Sporosarcina sp. P35]